MVELLNSIADGWLAYQWGMFWQVGVLVAIVWGIDVCIHKWVWPQVRYALWLLVLVKLLVPPTLTSPASVTSPIPAAAEKVVSVRLNTPDHGTDAPATPASDNETQAVGPNTGTQTLDLRGDTVGWHGQAPLGRGVSEQGPPSPQTLNNSPPAKGQYPEGGRGYLSWKAYAMFTWLAGVIVLATWLAARLRGLPKQHIPSNCHPGLDPGSSATSTGCRIGVRHDKKEGGLEFDALLKTAAAKLNLKRLPEVIVTERVTCPAVFGVLRPVLLMPATKFGSTGVSPVNSRDTGVSPVNHGQLGHAAMTARDMEHILLHELAHIKRGDLLVHAVYMCLQIAYWFNPLLWMIRRKLQNLRELCCDATVARLLKEDTVHYRQTLLETARGLLAQPVDPGLGLLGLFENSAWLATRLKWLEKNTWKNRPLRTATVMALVSVMAVCVLPMANHSAKNNFFIDTTQGYVRCNASIEDVGRMLVDMAHTYKWKHEYSKGVGFGKNDPEPKYSTDQYFVPPHHKLTIEAASENRQPLNIRFTLEDGADYTREDIMIELSRRLGMLPKAKPLKMALPAGVQEAVLLPEYNISKTVLSLKTGQFVGEQQAEEAREPYLAFNYSAGRQPQKRTVHNVPEDEIGVIAGNMDLAGGGFNKDYEAAQGMWLAQSVDQLPDFKMSSMTRKVSQETMDTSDAFSVKPFEDTDWPYITAFRGDDGTYGVFEITKVQDRQIHVRFRTIGTVHSDQSPVTSKGQKTEAASASDPIETVADTGDQSAIMADYSVIERKLTGPKEFGGFDADLFDFCTNTVFDFPPDVKFWDVPQWMAEQGIDVVCMPSENGPTLTGNGKVQNAGGNICKFVKTDLPMDCSAADLEKAWKSSQSQETIDHGGWDNLPARVFFKSRDNDSGILEVTAIDELEKTITFRYKLLETKQTESVTQNSEPNINRYTAVLSNGATVELVGICEHPSEGKQWWRPDGVVLDQVPYPKMETAHTTAGWGRRVYEAAVKISGVDDFGYRNRISDSGGGGSCSTDEPGVHAISFSQPKSRTEVQIEIGVAAGAWRTVSTQKADFSGVISSEGLIWHGPIEQNGRTVLTTAHGLLDQNVRVIAVGIDGKEHTGGATSATQGDMQSMQARFKLPLAQIKQFRLQSRPYEWVTFKHVSLRSGFKTDVEATVINTQPPKSQNSDAPKPLLEGDSKSAVQSSQDYIAAAENYAAELPLSGHVELVSVCQFIYDENGRLQEKHSWKPDGSVPEDALFSRGLQKEGFLSFGCVIKFSKRPQDAYLVGPSNEHHSMDQFFYNSEGRYLSDGKHFSFDVYYTDTNRSSVTLKLQPHNWSSIARYDGKYMIGRYDDRVRFVESYEKGGAKVVFEFNDGTVETRMTASYTEYDKNNNSSTRTAIAGIETARNAEGKEVKIASFRQNLSDIREFRLETRPKKYEFVEFRNVAFKPNAKTDKSQTGVSEQIGPLDLTPAGFEMVYNQERGVHYLVVQIKNESDLTLPKHRIRYYRGDPAEGLDETGHAHSGWHEAGPIEPGTEWNERTSDFHLPDGEYEFSVVLDYDQAVAETNEDNNAATLKVRIEAGKIVESAVAKKGEAGRR